MQNSIRQDAMFQEISSVLNPIGLLVVDIRRSDHHDTVHVVTTITTSDHTAGIDECAKAHKILFPRLSLLIGDRNLDLEVSTPGIQRNFRDIYEFSLFAGKRCRVYDTAIAAWVEGIIASAGDDTVELTDAVREDETEVHATYQIPHSRIQKAKLAYAWEDM